MKLVTIIVGVLLFALATMIIYGWGMVKQKNESQDLMNLLFSKGESKVKKYLKNNIDFEENIVLIDNEICKVEFIGKSKLKLVNGKEVQNKKKTLGTEFVGYKYNIENNGI